jgi:hypothetical protein
MPDPIPLVSGVAATLAALFAGANLYILGRRERQKWLRESLLEAFADYLGMSFDTGLLCSDLERARAAGATPDELRAFETKLDHLLRTQLGALTRIRLLADGRVVAAAQDLHMADHARVDWARRPQPEARDGDLRRKLRTRAVRDEFLLAAKGAMGIAVPTLTPSVESWTAHRNCANYSSPSPR